MVGFPLSNSALSVCLFPRIIICACSPAALSSLFLCRVLCVRSFAPSPSWPPPSLSATTSRESFREHCEVNIITVSWLWPRHPAAYVPCFRVAHTDGGTFSWMARGSRRRFRSQQTLGVSLEVPIHWCPGGVCCCVNVLSHLSLLFALNNRRQGGARPFRCCQSIPHCRTREDGDLGVRGGGE